MKIAKLGDLLPDDALEQLLALVKEGRYAKGDLTPVLEPHREALHAKGVLVEYLAYVLEYLFAGFFVADRKGYCASCDAHMRMPDSAFCQMCEGDLWYQIFKPEAGKA